MKSRKKGLTDLERRELEYAHLNLDISKVNFRKLRNPFKHYNTVEDYMQVLKAIRDPKNFYFTCKYILNIEPGVFQLVWLEHLWNYSFPMLIANRGASKTFTVALYYMLRALITQGCKIIITSASFRQAKFVFEYMENIWNGAPVLRDLCGDSSGPKRGTDVWTFRIGSSIVKAIPLGTGEKVRGSRANYIVVEEFSSVNEEIFEVILRGFTSTSTNPIENIKNIAKIQKMKDKKLWTNETAKKMMNINKPNQIILSGTASWDFHHFATYWKRYSSFIKTKGDPLLIRAILGEDPQEGFDWQDYCVIRIPIELLPKGVMDEKAISNAKATMDKGRWELEYGACFSKDSAGFFRRSLIEACSTKYEIVLPSGPVKFGPCLQGDSHGKYVMAIDPASESDNFCIYILELHSDHVRAVYCWTTTRERMFNKFNNRATNENNFYGYVAKKIRSLMKQFNVEYIAVDSQGGGIAVIEILHDIRRLESGELPIYPLRQDDPVLWPGSKDYGYDDEPGMHMLDVVSFAKNDWLIEANHGLKKALESKTLLFPYIDSVSLSVAQAVDRHEESQYDTVEDVFLEIQESIEELSTITHSTTLQGRDKWDTPETLLVGGKKGRMRKDRYSALLMAHSLASRVNRPAPTQYSGTAGGFAVDYAGTPTEGRLYTGADWFCSAINKSKLGTLSQIRDSVR